MCWNPSGKATRRPCGQRRTSIVESPLEHPSCLTMIQVTDGKMSPCLIAKHLGLLSGPTPCCDAAVMNLGRPQRSSCAARRVPLPRTGRDSTSSGTLATASLQRMFPKGSSLIHFSQLLSLIRTEHVDYLISCGF
ncbi:beta-catenin-interacting protein 1 isoform X1 [Corvus kubaryi]|uniref:beta-catenin-interacting protein 1 isoform X1 n=1 Tax=Corvus kubaryi TaxID=68294 RepID=UPI001C04B2DD|nr:beta-catenin-interacting protein 1 isoform X1 [Corvus kubaryi]